MTATKDRLKLVEITWKDHCGMEAGWRNLNDIASQSTPIECISMGAIVKETPEYISLIHTLAENNQAQHAMTILKSDIVKRRKLYTK